VKKGIVIRAFSSSSSFLGNTSFLDSLDGYKKCFEEALEHGFVGVQIYTEIDSGFLSLQTEDRTVQEIGHIARSSGVEIPSLEIAPLQYSVLCDSREERARGIAVVSRALRMASLLGSKGVLFIPGYVGLPWVKGGGTPVQYEDAYHRTLEALTILSREANQTGVNIHIENIWNMFLLSPLEMRQMVDQVGSESVGVLLDVGNVLQFGFPEQWIRILGSRIREVHLKDFRRSVGTVEGFVPLLSGDANWPEIMRALHEVGYQGYLIAEAFPYDTYGDTLLAHLSASMDRLMNGR
jgi:L-ribulose-5-phosphate 3-epimerase